MSSERSPATSVQCPCEGPRECAIRVGPMEQWKNPDLLLRNLDFLLNNVDFYDKTGPLTVIDGSVLCESVVPVQ